jgi:hypothetical protein
MVPTDVVLIMSGGAIPGFFREVRLVLFFVPKYGGVEL